MRSPVLPSPWDSAAAAAAPSTPRQRFFDARPLRTSVTRAVSNPS